MSTMMIRCFHGIDAVNCESRQVYKKWLRNGAVGVFFRARFWSRAGAQKN